MKHKEGYFKVTKKLATVPASSCKQLKAPTLPGVTSSAALLDVLYVGSDIPIACSKKTLC